MLHSNRECNQPQKKEILRDWLMKMLNSGQIPGLTWVDKGKLIFKIPWKHRGKQDWSEDNGLIFKAWAVHTGKKSDPEDYAKWKTRLRCALHKAEGIIEEKGMNITEGDEPFRAYRFTQLKTKRKRNPNLYKELTVGGPAFRQSLDSVNYFNQFENIPTVVQHINFEDSEELLETDQPHADSTVELSSDMNEDESVGVFIFTPSEGNLDIGSSGPYNIIGISIEVQFKGQTILKDSFCKNERVLLKSSCHLYREDQDMTVDKIITIDEKGNSILQDILKAMAEGLHFLYAEEELIIKQATRCEVFFTHFSPMETIAGLKLADEHATPFDNKSLIKLEIFQNSTSQHEVVHRDGLTILIKPITNEIN